MTERRKSTRRDLLIAVEELQGIIGRTISANNDRNQNREAQVSGLLHAGLDYCIEVRSYDDQVGPRSSPWRGLVAGIDIGKFV